MGSVAGLTNSLLEPRPLLSRFKARPLACDADVDAANEDTLDTAGNPNQMRQLTLSIALTLLLAASAAGAPPTRNDDDRWVTEQPRLYQIAHDPIALQNLLDALWKRYPDFHARLRAIALLRLGTPYVLGCLGEESGRDKNPVFRLDESDCTVNVLTSTAMAHARSLPEARGWMTRLNYYPGENPVRYENRVHFTEDRIRASQWFHDITPQIATGTPLASVRLTLNRGSDGTPLLPISWKRATTIRYLRQSDVSPALLARLPASIAGVAFVREKLFPKGIAVAHEGFVVDRQWLVHADSITKKTVRTQLCDYLRKNADWFDGVMIFSIE